VTSSSPITIDPRGSADPHIQTAPNLHFICLCLYFYFILYCIDPQIFFTIQLNHTGGASEHGNT